MRPIRFNQRRQRRLEWEYRVAVLAKQPKHHSDAKPTNSKEKK
jgi:hypothetical protein